MKDIETDIGRAGRTNTRASGPGRLIIAIYAVLAIGATARSAVQIGTKFAEAPMPYVLSSFAALVYIVATVSLARAGTRAFWIAVAAVSVEMAGVLVVGGLSIWDAQAFGDDTVWSGFGRGYVYVPLVLPMLGLWWLHRNRPDAPRPDGPQAGAPHDDGTRG